MSALEAGRGRLFGIPMTMNPRVEHFIRAFQRPDGFFARVLERASRYLDMMREVFRRHEAPEDLVYLALIESEFHPHARSSARAVGPWQFIPSTARHYGLRVDRWMDERCDPERSTVAAARYLRDLYEMFNSWPLAIAAYNAGETRIRQALKRHRTEDFWQMSTRAALKQETRDYVPKYVAVTLIAKQPDKYGLGRVRMVAPLTYDIGKVPERTPLKVVAAAAGVSVEELRRLNPALLRGVTPPDVKEYPIRIPHGTKQRFAQNFPRELTKARRAETRRRLISRRPEGSGLQAMTRGPEQQKAWAVLPDAPL